MSGHIGVGGAWKEIVNGTAVGVSGAWKNVSDMWVGVSGVWKQVFSAITLALDTDVDTVDFGGNVNGYILGVVGSIVDGDYVDGDGITRTIEWISGDGGFDTFAYLRLQGTGIPNNDNTFAYLITDGGAIVARANATYNGSDNGGTSWTWGNGIFVGGPATHNLQVYTA